VFSSRKFVTILAHTRTVQNTTYTYFTQKVEAQTTDVWWCT